VKYALNSHPVRRGMPSTGVSASAGGLRVDEPLRTEPACCVKGLSRARRKQVVHCGQAGVLQHGVVHNTVDSGTARHSFHRLSPGCPQGGIGCHSLRA
jgi:hypothetical protein